MCVRFVGQVAIVQFYHGVDVKLVPAADNVLHVQVSVTTTSPHLC